MQLAQIYDPNVLSTPAFTTNVSTVATTPVSFFERIRDAFQTAFESFIAFMPQIVAALLVVILGWAIAVLLGQLVRKLLTLTRVDKALDRLGLKRLREDTGLKLTVAGFVGGLVKWFLIIVAVLAAADILRLSQISEFLRSVLSYFPNVIVAVVIATIGVLIKLCLQARARAGRAAEAAERAGHRNLCALGDHHLLGAGRPRAAPGSGCPDPDPVHRHRRDARDRRRPGLWPRWP
ncbi:MAG: hypothetical protein U0514_03125 [Candidatus Andersenbacteria bacterium]